MREAIEKEIKERIHFVKSWFLKDQKRVVWACLGGAVLLIYVISSSEENTKISIRDNSSNGFKNAKILENPYKDLYKNKINLLEETKRKIKDENTKIKTEVNQLRSSIEDLKTALEQKKKKEDVKSESPQKADKVFEGSLVSKLKSKVNFSGSALDRNISSETRATGAVKRHRKKRIRKKYSSGEIKFPVKIKRKKRETGIVLSRGSYVKAKIIAGARIPNSKTYPLLLQLDYAFIQPSHRRLDLTSCMMIVKAESDMSTEKVTGSPDSIACFSKSGTFFEKTKLKGWLADGKDGEFGLSAQVVTHQGKVARWAFTKSIVEGAVDIISRKSKRAGGANPDRPDVLVQKGAGDASNMFADFLLKQAKSLLPYLHVRSSEDAYVVMGESIRIPYEFFKKGERSYEKNNFTTDVFN